ncbi:MAG: response regulator [Acidobacteriota bacterium]
MKRKTVLVISDGQEQFASTALRLFQEGVYVRFENDVDHGLAGDEPPNLIISELAVANVDGLQLCRRMRRDRHLARTPVLLVGDLSKYSSIVRDSFKCGAADYMQKPLDPVKLADLCRSMLTGK